MSKLINIVEANYLDNYKIYFKFDDGKENVVDFETFILTAIHPDIQKYKDLKQFKHFSLAYGDIEWNDYELAFPIYDLYKGNI